MKHLPNILTTLRLACPFYFILIVVLFDNQAVQSLVIFYLFIILSFTDYLDGLIARRLNITSNFGKVFDPISDKVLASLALLFLCSLSSQLILPAFLIVFREFLISGAREFSLLNNNINIKVSYLSKIKTTLQFFILSFLLFFFSFEEDYIFNEKLNVEKIIMINILGLWLVAILTLYTGFQYCSYIYFKIKKG